jgi:hypothetical protein
MHKGGVGASLSLPAPVTPLELPATGDQKQRHSLTDTAADDVADPSLILLGLRRGMGQISALLTEKEGTLFKASDFKASVAILTMARQQLASRGSRSAARMAVGWQHCRAGQCKRQRKL